MRTKKLTFLAMAALWSLESASISLARSSMRFLSAALDDSNSKFLEVSVATFVSISRSSCAPLDPLILSRSSFSWRPRILASYTRFISSRLSACCCS